MPVYEVELDDGRTVEIEGDRQPTHDEVYGLLKDYKPTPKEPEFQSGLIAPRERKFSMYDVPSLVDKLSQSPLPTYGMDVPTESVPVALAKTVAGLGKGVVSPLGAAATALGPVEAAGPALKAGFGLLGAKGLTDIATEQITKPEARPKTLAQAVELGGQVLPQLAMAAAPFAGTLTTKAKGAADALKERIVTEGGQPEHIGTTPLGVPTEAGGGNRPVPEAPVQAKEVVAATYTNPETGQTTTAPNHIEAAEKQGVEAPQERSARETKDYGFEVQDKTTGQTEVVSRDDAEKVARESGQLLKEPEGEKLHSNEIESPIEPGVPLSESKAPPPVIEGEAQPTVPAAGKAEGGVSAPPAPAIPEGGISPAKVQVGEPVDVSNVESVRATENGGRIAIILPDGTAVVGGQAHPDTWNKAVEAGVATDDQLANGVAGYVKPDGAAWSVSGKPLSKVSKAFIVGQPKASAGAKALAVREPETVGRTEREVPPPTKVEKGASETATLTPAESTRLKSLTEKMESGKPLTSGEQKRYRALKDKVSPPEGEKPSVEAAVKVPSSLHTDPSGNPVETSAPEFGRQYFRQDPESKRWFRVRYDGVTGRMDQHTIHQWTWLDGPQKGSTSTQYGQGGFFSAKTQVAEPYVPTERGVITDRFQTEQELKQTRSEARSEKGMSRQRLNEKARLLAAKLKQIDEYSATEESKRKSTVPPTTPPSTGEGMVGPGSPAITQPPDPGSQIEQLTSAFKNISGRKVGLQERLSDAFKVGERLSGAKDRLSQAISGLKTSGDYLIGKWKQVQNIDDLLRAKGELSESKETRGWQVRQWIKQAKKATPSPRDQAAISKYIDAGGNDAEIQRGLAETKPRFKRAYQDALNLSPDLKVAAQNISNYFDSRLQEAIDSGVLQDGIEDYIHRIYESKPELGKRAFAHVQDGILQKNPSLTKKRLFEFDWQAEKEGFVPVQSYIDRIADYESSLSRAIAAREFIKKATEMKADDGRPIVDIKGVGVPVESPEGVREATLIKPKYDPAYANTPGTPKFRGDYVDREYPALSRWKWAATDSAGKPIFVQGDVAIHPDYVKRVDALLEPSRVRYGRYGAIARPALAVSSAVKQTMLDLSGFHQVQVTVHGMEHRVMPWQIVKDIDFQNPNVSGLLKGGVTLGGDYRFSKEGLVGSSLTRHVPLLGPALDSYHQWLFQDYIPRLKMTMALHALERNKSRYAKTKTPEEIFHQTASEANAAFGEQNYIMLERSKTAQDMARLIMLAPDFLEARGRFAGQALTRGGKGFGNEQRTALLLGALTMWVTARLMNKAISGQPHNEPENLFSVVYKGKAYSLRTVQGDILHLLEKPLQFWMHRLNPVFGRTALEAATGRDEFGRKRSFSQQVWDGVSTMTPIALRTSREKSIWESLSNSFGVTARRWSDVDDAFKLAKEWKAEHGVQAPGEFIYDPDKDPLRPLKIALSIGDEGSATKEIKKLAPKTPVYKLQDHFIRYASMPFTGSVAGDYQWKKTLSEDQLKTVQAAVEHKRAMLKLFNQAAKKYLDAR